MSKRLGGRALTLDSRGGGRMAIDGMCMCMGMTTLISMTTTTGTGTTRSMRGSGPS